jgi:UDPglucose 6-dehydrogenase
MATPRLADLRNIYSVKDAKRAGFEAYDSIGRQGFPPLEQVYKEAAE